MKYFNFKFLLVFFALAMAIPPALADETLTICEGTQTSEFVPFACGYSSSSTQNLTQQIIYPKSYLEDVSAGSKIKSIKFKTSSSYSNPTSVLGSRQLVVRMGEVADDAKVTGTDKATNAGNGTLYNRNLMSTYTEVYTGTPTINGQELTITFTTEYEYNGGNLAIEIYYNQGTGSGSSIYWLGVNSGTSGCSGHYRYAPNTSGNNKWRVNIGDFLPQMTISFEPGTLPEYKALVTPDAIDYGISLPNTPQTQDVTVTNKGVNSITPVVSGLTAPFSTTYTRAALASGETATIPIVFNPTTVGDYTATLQVSDAGGNITPVDIPLSGSCAYEITICDESSTSKYLPIYGNGYDYFQKNQMIYPASMLTGLTGKDISSMTFYANSDFNFSGGQVTLRIGTTTDQDSYSSRTRLQPDDMIVVASGFDVPSSGNTWTIVFDDTFTYDGGNLVVDFEETSHGTGTGSYSSQDFAFNGVTRTGGGFYSYYSTYNDDLSSAYSWGSVQNFLPKVTFAFEDATPTIEVSPASLTINDATTGQLTVTGSNVDGNIEASLSGQSDWNITQSLPSAGGTVDVSYTGRYVYATNTATISATGAENVTVPVTYQPTMYIVGDYGDGNSWDFANGIQMTNNNGVQTATVTTTNDTYLLFSKSTNVAWGTNEQYLYGPVTQYNTNWDLTTGLLGVSTYLDLSPGAHSCIAIPASMAGTYNITFNNSDGTFTITKEPDQVISGTVTPTTVTMNAEVGTPATATVTIENTGNTVFTPTLTLTDANSVYSISAAEEIAAGESKTVTITYNPNATGTHNATLAVDINGTVTNVTISGTATQSVSPGGDSELTICDGEATNGNIPVWGANYNNKARNQSQMIYPSTMLTGLVGKEITGLKFYTSDNIAFSGGSLDISIGTTNTSQVGWSRITGLTQVVSGLSATSGGTEWEITFSEPFLYEGNNIIIDFELKTAGTAGATTFVGEEQSYASYYTGANGIVRQSFLPKVTFIYSGGAPEPTATASPAELAFGNVVLNTASTAQTVTLTNTGEVAFTPAFSLTDGFATTATPAEIAVNGSMQIPVTFTPTQEGEYNGTLTITSGNRAVLATVELTGTGVDVIPDYAVTVSPDGGSISFGTVDPEDNASSTRTITVTNTGLNAITPTLSALEAPFSTDYTAAPLAAGESVTITITFTPTEEGTFTDNATLTFGNNIADREFTLTGKGGQYDANDHSALYDMTYDWTDDNGTPHTSNLLETATDPNQIIAMLRKIYMTKEIPGNKKRGYTREGAVENWRVSYPAVGQLTRTYTSGSGYSYEYTDAYGWNIPTEKPILNTTLGSYNYYYLDPTEYEPNEEGVTLIMIELKDLTNFSGNSNYYSISSNSLSLKEKIANAFKSARIIKDFKQSGTGEEAGTLFKIDADKLNRFFLIAKGQLRLIDHTYGNFQDGYTFSEPSYRIKNNSSSGNYTDNYFTEAVMYPFIHMFEQFSPNVASTGSTAQTDEYQKLINMESFYVIHDCPSAAFITGNHEFNMYGLDSESDDCQDVRDMMFFVPEYRMKNWGEQYAVTNARDFSSEKFVNYYHEGDVDLRPKMGLYVIRQNEITGEQQANADMYDLNLSWESNLLDFLPGDEAEYDLYRVVIDPNTGEKTYEFVATIPSGQTTYVDHVAMEENGQMVTYVVQGQDTEHFLSLQMSNEESYIIPGLDPDELMTLSPKFEHYARFEPETETNYYANQLKVTNAIGAYIKESFLESTGAQFTFYRSYTDDNDVEQTVPIFTAVKGSGNVLNITEQNQRAANTYNKKGVDWIKMTNPSTVSYTVDGNGNVTFQNFNLYDNIAVSVADNNHPGMYSYKVELTYTDGGEQKTAHSNKIGVVIHKTSLDLKAYDEQAVIDDTDHQLPLNQGMFDIALKYSSKTEILRYDAYRWTENEDKDIIDFDDTNTTFNPTTGEINEQDIAPNGIAGNQGTFYTVKMNAVDQGQVTVNQTGTTMATFVDEYAAQNPDNYFYAPVVETFTGRDDYNTYGAPLQEANVTGIEAEVGNYWMSTKAKAGSNPYWTENGKTYAFYTVELKLTEIENMPEDYDLYKVRVWRKVDRNLLNEKPYNANNPGQYRGYRLNEKGEYMMEEVGYATFSKTTQPTEYQLGQSSIEPTAVYNGQTLTLSPGTQEVRATFGAQKLRENAEETGVIESLPMKFIVRAYYTNLANIDQYSLSNRAPRRDGETEGDGKYYITEDVIDFTFDKSDLEDDEHTGLTSVVTDREVTSVTYYNVMGQQSSKPFDGVNIVITRYNDGTTTTSKVLR